MKILARLTFIVLLVTLFNFSCKKSSSPSVAQRVQAKWTLVSLSANSHYSGSDHINTIPGTSADYVDFRSDSKVYSQVSGSRDTSNYSMSGDTAIIIALDKYKIITLTDAALQLYIKAVTSPSVYDEETISLKK